MPEPSTIRPVADRRPRRGVTVASLVAAGLAAGLAGCVERELVVDSEPGGALVYMNDQEVGRTPFRRPFDWYGTYDVAVRKEGYETLRARTPVIAPPWLWVPFDLVAELLPVRVADTHRLRYELTPTTDATVDPQQMVRRAQDLQRLLESGERKATTVPASGSGAR